MYRQYNGCSSDREILRGDNVVLCMEKLLLTLSLSLSFSRETRSQEDAGRRPGRKSDRKTVAIASDICSMLRRVCVYIRNPSSDIRRVSLCMVFLSFFLSVERVACKKSEFPFSLFLFFFFSSNRARAKTLFGISYTPPVLSRLHSILDRIRRANDAPRVNAAEVIADAPERFSCFLRSSGTST